jgi:hypothetical protein
MKKWLTEKWQAVSALLTKKRLIVAGAVLVALVCGVLVRDLAGRRTSAGGSSQASGQTSGAKPKGKPTEFFDGADVYFAGTYNDRAHVWKNGAAQELGNDMGWSSYANSIFVSGGNVYVAGNEDRKATVWKNGVAQRLSDSPRSDANSVFVSGNDVYVAGINEYEYTRSLSLLGATTKYKETGQFATLWKNGVAQKLDNVPPGYASSVFVSSDDVYVAGGVGNIITGFDAATVWKTRPVGSSSRGCTPPAPPRSPRLAARASSSLSWSVPSMLGRCFWAVVRQSADRLSYPYCRSVGDSL